MRSCRFNGSSSKATGFRSDTTRRTATGAFTGPHDERRFRRSARARRNRIAVVAGSLPALHRRHGRSALWHRHRHHRRRTALPGSHRHQQLEPEQPAAGLRRRRGAAGQRAVVAVCRNRGRSCRTSRRDAAGRRAVHREHSDHGAGQRLLAAASGPPSPGRQRRSHRRGGAAVPGRSAESGTPRTRRGDVPVAADRRPAAGGVDRAVPRACGRRRGDGRAAPARRGAASCAVRGAGPCMADDLLDLPAAGPGVHLRRTAVERVAALAGTPRSHRPRPRRPAAHGAREPRWTPRWRRCRPACSRRPPVRGSATAC